MSAGVEAIGVVRLDLAATGVPDRPAPLVELWYPGAPTAARGGGRRAVTSLIVAERHSAVADAPLAATPAKFPIVLYFPGWAATFVDNVSVVEQLAGHGFVVATVHYPAPRQRAERERPMDFSSEAAYRETLDRANRRVRERAADAVAILDALEHMAGTGAGRHFTDRLDLERAGIFGFSLGGAVAAEACLIDRRFKAAANLDGWHFGDAAERDIVQPYLFISDDTPPPTPADLAAADPIRRLTAALNLRHQDRLTANLQNQGGYFLCIAGSRHPHFAGSLRPSLLRRVSRVGRIAPWHVLRIACTYTLALFETHLKGTASTLLSAPDPANPETRLRIWPRPQAARRRASR